ncbi:hypothetical protein AVEN_208718-1 [Araneus ventricosus]|uniref:Uncharacterized protein n=1 Tax=Araneus ventricosus TaxID=182803 RepID=A0A4Y2KHF5_ARAVE|nr:hypothetical protein AVEN_208718-1 [Araneus ventricosus]
MSVSCHLLLALAFATVFLFSNVDAENLRQRICKGHDGPCSFDQYRCLNNKCVQRTEMCNGRNDCGDNSDETYCSHRGNCPTHRSFFCGKNNNYVDRCFPLSWKCDGERLSQWKR